MPLEEDHHFLDTRSVLILYYSSPYYRDSTIDIHLPACNWNY